MLRHMRTSVDIPDPLLSRAKNVARERRTTLRQLVLEGLRRVIEDAPDGSYEWRDGSFGGDGLVDGLTPDDWGEIQRRAYEGRGG